MFTISENEKLLSSCKIASKDVKDATSSSEKIGLLETPTADDISLSDPLPNTATAPPSSAKLPQSDATVQEVRAFIAATFVANHGTTAEYAQKTAQKWMLGRGWCLRELPSVRFTEIFGDVIGPHLAWDVKHGKEEERAAIRAKKTAADDFEMQRVTSEQRTAPHLYCTRY